MIFNWKFWKKPEITYISHEVLVTEKNETKAIFFVQVGNEVKRIMLLVGMFTINWVDADTGENYGYRSPLYERLEQIRRQAVFQDMANLVEKKNKLEQELKVQDSIRNSKGK